MKHRILNLLLFIFISTCFWGITADAASITNAKTYNSGGNTIEDALGCSRNDVLDILAAHVNDTYYLTTPFVGGDYRNPNGDPAGYGAKDKKGVAAMNCTGFVWHVLTKAGGSNVPAMGGWISGWVRALEDHKIEYRTYTNTSSTNDMINTILTDGYIEPGDIIWTWDAGTSLASTGLPHQTSGYHHVGIYIGDYFDDLHTTGKNWLTVSNSKNRWWHSTSSKAASKGFSGNQTSYIHALTSCKAITVVKLSNEKADIYHDVHSPSWYYNDVLKVTGAGLMEGYSNGNFGPEDSLTRGQFAAILYRMSGNPTSNASNTFKDVRNSAYYTQAITWANAEGLIIGYGNSQFGPDDPLTREQLTTILYRYTQYKGQSTSITVDHTSFPDDGLINEYAKEAMNWAIGEKIIKGTGSGTLNPLGNVSRAECAAILSRYLKL